MNKQIEKLVNKLDPIATICEGAPIINWNRVEWKDNVYPQFGDKLYAAIDLQKFAELIVQECVGVVADAVDHREPASTYVSKITQHFGVK